MSAHKPAENLARTHLLLRSSLSSHQPFNQKRRHLLAFRPSPKAGIQATAGLRSAGAEHAGAILVVFMSERGNSAYLTTMC
jgi:hypothetical protein